MPTPNQIEQELFELLYSALDSPYGILVAVDDLDFIKHRLYPLRNSSPTFAQLSFIQSPENMKDLWIIKRPEE